MRYQQRGHCQNCGKEHAVRLSDGRVVGMANHGYKALDRDRFPTCPGVAHLPIELEAKHARNSIISYRHYAQMYKDGLARLEAGLSDPKTALRKERVYQGRGFTMQKVEIPYQEANAHEKAVARLKRKRDLTVRAGECEALAELLQRKIRLCHKMPLKVVELEH